MMLREQCPFVWLYFQKDLVAYNKKISNVCFEDYSLLNRSVLGMACRIVMTQQRHQDIPGAGPPKEVEYGTAIIRG